MESLQKIGLLLAFGIGLTGCSDPNLFPDRDGLGAGRIFMEVVRGSTSNGISQGPAVIQSRMSRMTSRMPYHPEYAAIIRANGGLVDFKGAPDSEHADVEGKAIEWNLPNDRESICIDGPSFRDVVTQRMTPEWRHVVRRFDLNTRDWRESVRIEPRPRTPGPSLIYELDGEQNNPCGRKLRVIEVRNQAP